MQSADVGNKQALYMKKLEELANAVPNPLELPQYRDAARFLHTFSRAARLLDCSVPVSNLVSMMPSTQRLLVLQQDPTGAACYISVVQRRVASEEEATGGEGGAVPEVEGDHAWLHSVVAKHVWTAAQREELTELLDDLDRYRSETLNYLLSWTDEAGPGGDWTLRRKPRAPEATSADEERKTEDNPEPASGATDEEMAKDNEETADDDLAEEEILSLLDRMEALFGPALQVAAVSAALDGPDPICILADKAFHGLPLEALKSLKACTNVTRDFSLHCFANRLKIAAAGPGSEHLFTAAERKAGISGEEGEAGPEGLACGPVASSRVRYAVDLWGMDARQQPKDDSAEEEKQPGTAGSAAAKLSLPVADEEWQLDDAGLSQGEFAGRPLRPTLTETMEALKSNAAHCGVAAPGVAQWKGVIGTHDAGISSTEVQRLLIEAALENPDGPAQAGGIGGVGAGRAAPGSAGGALLLVTLGKMLSAVQPQHLAGIDAGGCRLALVADKTMVLESQLKTSKVSPKTLLAGLPP